MRAPLEICSRRSVVAVLASGVVISMSALTGGVAPAFAKPDHSDPTIPVIPTTEVVAPEAPPEVVVPQEQAPVEAPRAPKEPPPPPKLEAPPQQALVPEIPALAPQVPAPVPQPEAPEPQPEAPEPQIQAPAPPQPKKEEPRVIDAPKVDTPKVDGPKVDTPKVDEPKVDTPKLDAPKLDAPNINPPKVDAPEVQPAEPAAPKQDAANLAPGQPVEPGVDAAAPDKKQPPAPDAVQPATDDSREAADDEPTDPSAVSKAAQQIVTAEPETLVAPEQDIRLAKQSKPIELKPEPAAKQDVDFLSRAIDLSSKNELGPFESEFNAGSEFSVGRDRDWDDKLWDKKVRQWDRDWIEYDDSTDRSFFNPFRAPVRIVYTYECPRIVIVQPWRGSWWTLSSSPRTALRAVVQLFMTSRTWRQTWRGHLLRRWFLPGIGVPFVAPPPLLTYDNVPVQVRYSNATYEPFRVSQIVDVGDDVQLRRAEGVARRRHAGLGPVDHVADRRAAIRGAPHSAVPRARRSARSAAAGRLPNAVGLRRVRRRGSHADVPDGGGRGGRRIGLRRTRPGRLPRAAPATGCNGASWSAGQLSGTPADPAGSATSGHPPIAMTCLVRRGPHPISWTAVQPRP